MDTEEVQKTIIIAPGDAPPEPESTESSAQLPSKSNQRYKFIRSIGFGGMKAVLLVMDTDTGREVAMAMMPDFRTRPAADLLRFNREARILAHLEHPNIVPVHDMGTDLSGAPFFTMKYLRGYSLASYLRKVRRGEKEAVQNFTLDNALRILIRVCNALDFAHSRGILHLDVKPDNVHLGYYEEVILLDWGLATPIHDHRLDDIAGGAGLHAQFQATQNGIAKGTPGFMSPEQASGRNDQLDQRADIYGLGALLYTILVLHSPMAGEKVERIMQATVDGVIPPVTECNDTMRTIPEALDAICRKAMAKNPADRYRSVVEFRDDIQAFRKGYAPEAQNASPLVKTALFFNRNFLESVMGAVIILLTAMLFYLLKRG